MDMWRWIKSWRYVETHDNLFLAIYILGWFFYHLLPTPSLFLLQGVGQLLLLPVSLFTPSSLENICSTGSKILPLEQFFLGRVNFFLVKVGGKVLKVSSPGIMSAPSNIFYWVPGQFICYLSIYVISLLTYYAIDFTFGCIHQWCCEQVII